MDTASYIALSHQIGLWRQMEVVANNLANLSTPAFKADRLIFAEFINPQPVSLDQSGAAAPISFVQDLGTVSDLRPGGLIQTGNAFDLAIEGPGYFVVETPAGPRYTRQGNLHADDQGRLVTGEGYVLLDTANRPIALRRGESRFEVTRKGQINTESGELARIQIVRFEDEQALKKLGTGLYEAATDPLPADDKIIVQQGALEGSNVQSILEVTTLIDITRRYQAAQRIIDSENDRIRKAIEKLGQVA